MGDGAETGCWWDEWFQWCSTAVVVEFSDILAPLLYWTCFQPQAQCRSCWLVFSLKWIKTNCHRPGSLIQKPAAPSRYQLNRCWVDLRYSLGCQRWLSPGPSSTTSPHQSACARSMVKRNELRGHRRQTARTQFKDQEQTAVCFLHRGVILRFPLRCHNSSFQSSKQWRVGGTHGYLCHFRHSHFIKQEDKSHELGTGIPATFVWFVFMHLNTSMGIFGKWRRI